MAREADSALLLKLFRIAFAFVALAVFVYAVRGMMFGSLGKAKLVLAAFVGGALVFALDDKYWLLLPFLFLTGISVPRLPFNGRELGCLVLIGVYFMRLALRREHPFRFDRDLLVILPVLFWMFLVWTMNPVGLAKMGSNMIGGRFYFDIAVGAITLFVLSTIRVTEKDARLLFFVILAAQCLVLARGIIFPGADPDALVFEGVEPERSTRYAFVVCSSIFMLLFSYWPLSAILAFQARIFLFAILSLLVVYSGKRRAFGTIALVPFLRMLLTGKEKMVTFVVSVLAIMFLVFAVAGDGVAYRLPKSARRVLAIVSSRYQKNDDGGFNDLFRRHMREQARTIIRENPWFGRKGFAMDLNETSWILFGGGKTSLFAGHAYAGNWHSAWYAYAADFGIPCMLLWAFFELYVLRYAFRSCRVVTIGRFLPTCCLYYSLWFFVDAAFSYTSGHASTTTFQNFVNYGLLMAVVRGYRREQGLDEQ
jgi:hypothetical protein